MSTSQALIQASNKSNQKINSPMNRYEQERQKDSHQKIQQHFDIKTDEFKLSDPTIIKDKVLFIAKEDYIQQLKMQQQRMKLSQPRKQTTEPLSTDHQKNREKYRKQRQDKITQRERLQKAAQEAKIKKQIQEAEAKRRQKARERQMALEAERLRQQMMEFQAKKKEEIEKKKALEAEKMKRELEQLQAKRQQEAFEKQKALEQEKIKKQIENQISLQKAKNDVKKWNAQQKFLKQKKQAIDALIQKKLQEQFKQVQQRKAKQKEMQMKKKKEALLNNLQKIEKRKKQRQEQLKNRMKVKNLEQASNSGQKSHKIPLYKIMQKSYERKVQKQEDKIRQNIIKKKQDMLRQINDIKKHQESFMNHLKERFQKKMEHSPRKDSLQENKKKHQYNIYAKTDISERQLSLDKFLRRKKFQEKLKSIPIKIDENKVRQALIAQDKSKNPIKYNYLSSVAALSDERIYEQFQDFDLNIDKKELGNKYMKIANRSVSQSRLKPLSRVSKESQRYSVEDKIEYKNYLPEIKPLLKKYKPKNSSGQESQIEQIMMKYDNNSQRIGELNKKSNKYESMAINQIIKLSANDQYEKVLKNQEQIDDCYVKALRIRIAGAELID